MMADKLNNARAVRVTELLRDYEALQTKLASIQASPQPGEHNQIGYTTLQQAKSEAHTLLNKPFSSEMLHPPTGNDEQAKRQLQRIILDASARRFKAQRIFLKAAAAKKWIDARNALLKGQKAMNDDNSKMQQVSSALMQELNNITDQRIYNAFRQKDQQKDCWLVDDPSLSAVQGWIQSHG
ncbi:uncharacterized protein KY384_006082 [Bacidia gigantensis]|uniref:uncharacterized protein n=1 Tax=Bacidia gigantensis TaxID=2732470 RepID=UPI001D045317|nr:uncharacterized protein KY384_006082 [Bacidia gigantensis]KAG8529445.1 hypothetical protein KY384_006082 [Bacidia gigantensis]